MDKRTIPSIHGERRAAAELAQKLTALGTMTTGELAAKYRELFGVPTRTRNRQYLRKRIAFRIQEAAEGRSLTQRALALIDRLAPDAPARWRSAGAAREDASPRTIQRTATRRDTRLPPPGTIVRRVHDGREHRVTVLERGFEFEGKQFRSLSTIAKLITGTSWNGFSFFLGRGNAASTEATSE